MNFTIAIFAIVNAPHSGFGNSPKNAGYAPQTEQIKAALAEV